MKTNASRKTGRFSNARHRTNNQGKNMNIMKTIPLLEHNRQEWLRMAAKCREKSLNVAADVMEHAAQFEPGQKWECGHFDAVQDVYRSWLVFDKVNQAELMRAASFFGIVQIARRFSYSEAGPFAELEDGSRVYGLAGQAPFLLAALQQYMEDDCDPHKEKRAAWKMAIAAMQKN